MLAHKLLILLQNGPLKCTLKYWSTVLLSSHPPGLSSHPCHPHFRFLSRLQTPSPSVNYNSFEKSHSCEWCFSSFNPHSTFLTPLAVISVDCAPDDVLGRFVGRADSHDGHTFWKREVKLTFKISSSFEPHSRAEREEFWRNTSRLPWGNKTSFIHLTVTKWFSASLSE